MTFLRPLAILVVVSCALISSALACSGSSSPPSEAGADASNDLGTKDATPEAGKDAADADVDGGPPHLTALSVSPLPLTPAFSPSINDYYVRCASGTNALSVSMTASAGSESSLSKPTASGSSPMQTVKVNVTENAAIVAEATRGTASVQYWIRCLPHDFPELLWVEHPEAGTPTPGYYLVGNLYAVHSGSYAMMLDGHGVPVWYTQAGAAGTGVSDVDSLTEGSVSYFITINDPVAAKFTLRQLNPPPTVTSALGPDGAVTDEHELRWLSNGDYIVISTPLQTGVDLTGMKLALADGGVESLTGNYPITACNLVEFQPDGTIVWSWTGTDHLDAVKESVSPIPAVATPDGGLAVDPFHCNSIDVDPMNGNLLVSSRQMSSVFYVEKTTAGTIQWKMGGTSYNKDNATYVPVDSPFSGQHDARLQGWSPTCDGGSGSGQISVFDDETYGPGAKTSPARAALYNVVVGPPDGGAGACDAGPPGATLGWHYPEKVIAAALGSFRIEPDGTRLIGWGISGKKPNIVFSEVTSTSKDMLDFYFDDGNISYRAVKVPTSAFDIGLLRDAAGK
jgi:hypothetical protein